MADFHVITPEWFHTMSIPILQGRGFSAQDRRGTPEVVVINATLAKRLWPNESPVGKRLMVPDFGTSEVREVIGVAADTRQQDLEADVQPEIYRSLNQTIFPIIGLAVHTRNEPSQMVDTLRNTLQQLLPEQPLGPILSMEDRAAKTVALRKESALLLAVFSFLALSLAMVGIYGVVGYSVTRQTKEFGIRMVLGAQPRGLIASVMKQGMLTVAIGVGLGAMLALALTRLVQTSLYNVSSLDLQTFLLTPLFLLFVASIACFIPARRAAYIDPVEALRSE